jgi:phage terminase large subunit-like protein
MTDGYLGNQHLKKSGTDIEWTPELIKEYMKCAEDPVYFAKKYIRIVHVDRGLIPFEMYDYQEEIVHKIFNNRRVAVLTARQSGKTTTAVAVILHYILFNEYKTVAILANKGDSAREVLGRIQLAYEALPRWLQQGVEEWNKGNITLENGCKIYAGTTSSSAIRGKSISLLYLDEVAFIEGYDEFFASVYPTISSGESTKLLMTSTPNGLNHFWKTCKGAEEGTNGYQFVRVMWHDVPGRNERWKQETIEALDHDTEKFAQEYECVKGNTFVTVKDKETGEIKRLTIETLYKELNS